MLFEIKNQKLITENIPVIGITRHTNAVSVQAKVPIDSAVFLKMVGFERDYYVPMYVESTNENGHIFSCKIIFNNKQIDYILAHPKQVYQGYFEINKSLVEGCFQFTVYSSRLANQNRTNQDIIQSLVSEVASIRSKIYIDSKKVSTAPTATADIVKGMVPIATGVNNEAKWDFPFNSTINHIKRLSKLCKDLSDQVLQLTEKVNQLEAKVTDHIYEEYTL